jgi:hypothetical protein
MTYRRFSRPGGLPHTSPLQEDVSDAQFLGVSDTDVNLSDRCALGNR